MLCGAGIGFIPMGAAWGSAYAAAMRLSIGRWAVGAASLGVFGLSATACMGYPADGSVSTPLPPGQNSAPSRLPQLLSQLQQGGAGMELFDGAQNQVLAAQDQQGKTADTATPGSSATATATPTRTAAANQRDATSTPTPRLGTATPTSAVTGTPTGSASTTTPTTTATATTTPSTTPTGTATTPSGAPPSEGGGASNSGTPPTEH